MSKRSLFFSFMKLLVVLENLASRDKLAFPDNDGSEEIIKHYERVRANLLSLGKGLKEAAARTKREKDELVASEEILKRHK